MENFDIEDPKYEENVVHWVNDNLEVIERIHLSEMLFGEIMNVDFTNSDIVIGKDLNNRNGLYITFPASDTRVYYPKEIKRHEDKNITIYVIDDIFWVYNEHRTGLKSFGMDMTMPFLQSYEFSVI